MVNATTVPVEAHEGEALRLAIVGGDGRTRERYRDLLERQGHAAPGFAWSGALRATMAGGQRFDAILALTADPDLDGLGPPVVELAVDADADALRALLGLVDRVRRLESALEEQTRVGRHVAGALAHDLRNPLAAVIQLAEALSGGELLSAQGRADLEGLVAAARGAARRLEGLRQPPVEAALEAALAEIGEVPLRELVEDAMRHTGFPAGLVQWVPEDADVVVRADASAMRRAVEHVLANARVHGGGAAHMTVAAGEAGVLIEVVDEGAAERPLVEGGGLRLCRAVLAAHGGSLELRAREGGGLVARLAWPGYVRTRALGLVVTPTPAQAPNLRIWMVDDDRTVLRTMSRLLRLLGHDVRTFDRGAEVVAALDEGQQAPDLVLCDQDMPGMSGLEVLRRLRSLAPGSARVLFTGQAPTSAVVDAFNQGTVHRYIGKDDGPAAVRDCVSGLVAERRAHRRAASAPAREPVRADLETLLAETRIELFVQPLFAAGPERRLVACEALMRSRHPNFRGPLEILDAARAYDRELALQKVLSGLSRRLRDRLPGEVDLFVNIDPALLRSPRHLDEGLAPLYPVASGIVLELTERARLGTDMDWEGAVQRLREVGFRVALDDVAARFNSI